MKPITGSVISSKPLSVPEAAAILSQFVSSNTGAPQDIAAYLRRTSESFDELARIHEEIVGKQERKKEKKIKERNTAEDTVYPRRNPSTGFSSRENGSLIEFVEEKKRSCIDDGGGGRDVVEAEVEDGKNSSEKKRKKKKNLTFETVSNGNVTGGEGEPTLISTNGGGDFEEGKNVISSSERRKKKRKKPTPDAANNDNVADWEGNSNPSPSKGFENGGDGGPFDFKGGKDQKREKRWVGETMGDAGEVNGEFKKDDSEGKKKKKRKNRDTGGEEEVGELEVENLHHHKKRKRKVEEAA